MHEYKILTKASFTLYITDTLGGLRDGNLKIDNRSKSRAANPKN